MKNGIKFVQPTPCPDGSIGLRYAAKPRYDLHVSGSYSWKRDRGFENLC